MDAKQLRKLSRIQLLEMLIQKSREAEQLRGELDDAKRQLGAMSDAGALADAANRLSALMEGGALPQQSSPAAPTCPEAEEIIARAREEAARLLEKTKRECDEMTERARQESLRWWEETSRKMDAFYRQRPGLREMLADAYKQQDERL